jgi:hypothetical protein
MTSFAHDISFLKEQDSNFWDTGQNLEKVAARLVLTEDSKALSDEEVHILDALHHNMAVRYNDGIFRVSKVGENVLPDEDNKTAWTVEIEGHFTADDPNGHIVNGWKDEELVSNVKSTGAIADLEL